jgi:thiol-disulfide isomerase/thioredoxin
VSLLLIALVPSASSAVLPLNSSNFTTAFQQNKPVLTFFYAPWCGHCKAFQPIYHRFADNPSSPDVVYTKADASDKRDTYFVEKYKIISYPTIIYFPESPSQGDAVVYSGPKTPDGMSSFLESNALLSSGLLDLSSPPSLAIYNSYNHDIFINVTCRKNSELYNAALAVQKSVFTSPLLSHTKFVIGYTPLVLGSSSSPVSSLTVTNKASDTTVTLSNPTGATLSKFITTNAAPNAPNGHHILKYYDGLMNKLQTSNDVYKKIVLFVGREYTHLPEYMDMLSTVAGTITGTIAGSNITGNVITEDVINVWLDPVEYPEYLERYFINKNDLPAIVYHDVSGGVGTVVTRLLSLKMNGDGSGDGAETMPTTMMPISTETWINNVNNCYKFTGLTKNDMCSAKANAGSEPALKSNFSPGLDAKVLVGKNLNYNILNSTTDMFILFYAKDDSARVIEEYRQFARRFRVDYWVQFYEFVIGGNNDVPYKPFEILSTPALYFIPHNNKLKPILYKTSKKFENEHLIRWLDSVVTKVFTGYADNTQHGGNIIQKIMYNVRAFVVRGPFVWWKNVVRGEYVDLDEEELGRRMREKTGEL